MGSGSQVRLVSRLPADEVLPSESNLKTENTHTHTHTHTDTQMDGQTDGRTERKGKKMSVIEDKMYIRMTKEGNTYYMLRIELSKKQRFF